MKNSKDFVIENGHLRKYIGSDADVVIPDDVVEIDPVAFENCVNLVSVSIPDGVIELHIGVFYGCHELTTISFPHSVEKIGGMLFFDCPKLSTFILPEGISGFKGSVLEQLWESVSDKYNKRALTYALLKQYPKFVGEVGKLKRRTQSNIKPFITRALAEDDSDFFYSLFTYAGTLSVYEFEDYVERCKKSITLEQLQHYHNEYEAKFKR